MNVPSGVRQPGGPEKVTFPRVAKNTKFFGAKSSDQWIETLATFNRDSNMFNKQHMGLPRWHSGKESACQSRRCRRHRFNPWVGKITWRRKWQPTTVFLLGKFHGQRSLAGYNPLGRTELNTTEHSCTQKQNIHIDWSLLIVMTILTFTRI